jgi:hypothetical protein
MTSNIDNFIAIALEVLVNALFRVLDFDTWDKPISSSVYIRKKAIY